MADNQVQPRTIRHGRRLTKSKPQPPTIGFGSAAVAWLGEEPKLWESLEVLLSRDDFLGLDDVLKGLQR